MTNVSLCYTPPMILGEAEVKPEHMVVGKSKIFMKLNVQRLLGHHKNLALADYALCVQRCYRGYRARKRLWNVRALQKDLASWLEQHDGIYGRSWRYNQKSGDLQDGPQSSQLCLCSSGLVGPGLSYKRDKCFFAHSW